MPFMNIGDADLFYESHGSGEPIFLVSGLGGLASYWMPNIGALSRGHQVVVHDHRGTGRSTHSKIRYSVDQMTDDLLRLMDGLRIERAHIVGHSTGGAMAQTLAIRRPERVASLVLYATWTRCDPFFARLFEARRTLLMTAGAAAYTRATALFLYPDWWINHNTAVLDAREKMAVEHFPPPEVVASRIDAICAFDRVAELSAIRARTLVLCARDDFITPPYFSERLAAAIPGARCALLEKGGHCVSETLPDEFNAAVLEFIGVERGSTVAG